MSIITELHDIFEKNGEVLRAEDVVEFARNPKTELHEHFMWDDTEAARQYRLIQARNVIRVNVEMMESSQTTVRAFVSMVEDRSIPGGGYRRIEDVMANPEQRQKLLAQALKEANSWREKYRALQELAPIFAGIDRISQKPKFKAVAAKALNIVA